MTCQSTDAVTGHFFCNEKYFFGRDSCYTEKKNREYGAVFHGKLIAVPVGIRKRKYRFSAVFS